jgi:serine protease Do
MTAFFPGVRKCVIPALLIAFELAQLGAAFAGSGSPPAKIHLDDSPLRREVKAATSFAPIIKKAAPSVVNIYSSRTIHEQPMINPFMDPFFRQFFGPGFGETRPRRAESLGSGVIISEDGYILTANHVIEGAEEIKVSFAEGTKESTAKVVGADPPTDVAVLKIEGMNLPAITIGDSDKLEVGDAVLAIGNPFAVGQTVTRGIVSGVGRSSLGISQYENFIQTDASINPGNSGGALVDAEGRLVGINTAILSRTGGNQGIGFAVPVNMARSVMDLIIEHGKVTRGYLGVGIQALTPDLAKELGLPSESSGVVVNDIAPNSPAEKAGLKSGDVILEVNGKKVTEPGSLQLLIAQAGPASKTTLRVLHSQGTGKPNEKNLTVTLAELPKEALAATGRGGRQGERPSGVDALDGVQVTDLDSRVRRQLDAPNNVHGALVVAVDPESNSAEAGLRRGDIILEINRQPVLNADDAVALSENLKGEQVLLRVWSQGGEGGPGGTHYVVVSNRKRSK